jgi:predicted alpha/beta superfamily hydrolase
MEEISLQQNIASDPNLSKPMGGGELRLHEFTSRMFRNKRMLRIWTPAEYELEQNSGRRYPVFYLNDGQNLFESSTSFTGVEWRVGETAGRMIEKKLIPPMIFVGIDNARVERMKEYLPYRSVNPPVLRPRGERYPEFLVEEVMPYVAQQYRVAKGPVNTALGGSSLGGLISLYTILAAPGVFGYALLESASLWIANRRILRDCRGFRQWPHKMFVGVGTREVGRDDKDLQTVENVRELNSILRRSGLDERRLRVEIADGATHSEGAWAARFPDALRFFFGTDERTKPEPASDPATS